MVDLIVPAGTTLVIDQNYIVAPKYGLFSMEAGARITAAVDVAITADRAQFAANCVIDARGTPAQPTGPTGRTGPPITARAAPVGAVDRARRGARSPSAPPWPRSAR